MRDTEASAHIELRGINEAEAYTLITRYLSLLSWCSGRPMEDLDGFVARIPGPIPRRDRLHLESINFRIYRDIPRDPRARLALALYREGQTVNSVAFSFLSFFKILNIFWNDKKNRQGKNELVEGIRGLLPLLKYPGVQERIANLQKQTPDVPEYLYQSGRCAVAHAYTKPIVDPDNVVDSRRLSQDVLVIRAAAEYLIETKLDIPRAIMGVG